MREWKIVFIVSMMVGMFGFCCVYCLCVSWWMRLVCWLKVCRLGLFLFVLVGVLK